MAGNTAAAALAAIDLSSDDTVLVGGAAGGVGVFVVQLAKLAGATVIGASVGCSFTRITPITSPPGLLFVNEVLACSVQGATVPFFDCGITLSLVWMGLFGPLVVSGDDGVDKRVSGASKEGLALTIVADRGVGDGHGA